MTSKPAPHSWKPVSHNEWEQVYGFQDAFYGSILAEPGEPGLFLIATSMKFEFLRHESQDLVTQLRTAWMRMRLAYPIIASISQSKKRVYHPVQDMADLEVWANETFKVETERTTSDLWRHLVKTRQPMMRFLPKTNELFLQAEHSHFDGRGMLHFWDEFIPLLVNSTPLVLGQELGNLPGTSDDYLDTREKSPGRAAQLGMELVQSFEVQPPDTPVCYPLKNLDSLSQKPYPYVGARTKLEISPEGTSRILAGCKDRNVSLVAVWHAAMVLAAQDVQRDAGEAVGSIYVTGANLDLRKYFGNNQAEKAAKKAPIGNFHTILPCTVKPGSKSFLELAQELNSFYRMNLHEQPDIFSALRPMMQGFADAYAQGPPMDTTPCISTGGVVDYYLKKQYTGPAGALYIDDLWFGDTTTGPWLECFTWMWRGSLILSSCYNGTFYSDDEVHGFLERVTEHIKNGLGLRDSITKL
ncbi:hypothetical protein B0I35DRAFT_517104 [Stachybotrys elegans]|uniref:Condensation domain-containing protein n=1 Tax=Stachybotrys elegans TaxID=80388 RepID=A0A8K0SCN0_9HYPO|nr:hypothetical protein B0I35DRAFT_517104 [Stachybotrys elegans]